LWDRQQLENRKQDLTPVAQAGCRVCIPVVAVSVGCAFWKVPASLYHIKPFQGLDNLPFSLSTLSHLGAAPSSVLGEPPVPVPLPLPPAVCIILSLLLQAKFCCRKNLFTGLESRSNQAEQSRAESFFFACLLRNIGKKKGQGNCASKWSSWERHD
jgi:hypothetical protein